MAASIDPPSLSILNTDLLCLVSSFYKFIFPILMKPRLLPESPRWLITKDRTEEAYLILTKYHAEGDHDSEFVRAELAQIRSTLNIELEVAKQSWGDMVRTPGMRKRVLIASMLGLFTQWSGNTLLSVCPDIWHCACQS